jgi:hypothetical protein
MLALGAVIVLMHEQAIWREADARARIAATEPIAPDRLWAELDSLRRRAWLDVTTRGFARVVAERFTSRAVATLADYREDVPTIRKPHFDAARALLARAARIDMRNSTTEAWLRYAEGHLARIQGESLEDEERRPALREAVARFEQAAALAPHLPDPHIALARIYTYDIRDPDRARRAMSMAERLGHAPGLRGHAQLGDLFRAEGEAMLRQARELTGMNSEEPALVRARAELASAVDEYDQALGFAESARNSRQASAWIRAIDGRLGELRAEAAAAEAEIREQEPGIPDRDSGSRDADAPDEDPGVAQDDANVEDESLNQGAREPRSGDRRWPARSRFAARAAERGRW